MKPRNIISTQLVAVSGLFGIKIPNKLFPLGDMRHSRRPSGRLKEMVKEGTQKFER